jgi:hypothetical protein
LKYESLTPAYALVNALRQTVMRISWARLAVWWCLRPTGLKLIKNNLREISPAGGR